MIQCVIYTENREEGQCIHAAISRRVSLTMEERLDCHAFTRFSEAADNLEGCAIICWDMDNAQGREALARVRKHCRDGFLVAIASPATSPLTFLNPSIAPASLVFHPFDAMELRRVATEAVRDYQEKLKGEKKFLSVISNYEQIRIAYSDIYYIEARGRKLYIRMKSEEIGFTGVLERILGRLPQEFQKCHRSYIVNTDKIERLQLSENQIVLDGGILIPLSRSCKSEVREFCNGSI